MEKNKGFKNRVEKFFSSDDGQRILNFSYSFGAAIVIVGALFKIIHLPGADIMLCVGMGVEALIFALSAFDKPASNYHWERLFPVLQDEGEKGGDLAKSIENLGKNASAFGVNADAVMNGNLNISNPHATTKANVNTGASVNMSNSDISNSSYNAAGFAGMSVNNTQLEKATEMYVDQINSMVSQMERLKDITQSLTNVSENLLNSYSAITNDSGNISSISGSYIQQMDTLNKNITGLNTIYEIQLKSVSSHSFFMYQIRHFGVLAVPVRYKFYYHKKQCLKKPPASKSTMFDLDKFSVNMLPVENCAICHCIKQ